MEGTPQAKLFHISHDDDYYILVVYGEKIKGLNPLEPHKVMALVFGLLGPHLPHTEGWVDLPQVYVIPKGDVPTNVEVTEV